MKKVRKEGTTKKILIVDGQEITVDDDFVTSLDSKINDVKNGMVILLMIQIAVLQMNLTLVIII